MSKSKTCSIENKEKIIILTIHACKNYGDNSTLKIKKQTIKMSRELASAIICGLSEALLYNEDNILIEV